MKIIGAGLSGLLAGCMNPGSTIYERASELPNNHGAILRFRSNKIGQALGIPFKKVRVTKAIWYNGQEVEPTPRMQNMYSHKCTGKYIDRSISNIDPVDRWIAPEDFIQQLADRCEIVYDWDAQFNEIPQPVISTIPMHKMLRLVNFSYPDDVVFAMGPIWSRIHTVPDANIYQTIYFPTDDEFIGVYRASFTGDKLIIECVNSNGVDLGIVLKAFGMPIDTKVYTDSIIEEKYGKIVEIDHNVRRSIMATLTHEHNVYSLGRYATWRNILLDDVFEDIIKIRDLMKLDSYSRRLKL